MPNNTQLTSDPLQRRTQLSLPAISAGNPLAKSLQAQNKVTRTSNGSLAPITLSNTQPKSQGGVTGVLSALQNYTQGIGTMLNLSAMANDSVSQDKLAVRNGISDTISMIPGAAGVGIALKAVDAIGDLSGYHLDDIDPNAAQSAGISKSASKWSNIVNAIPGLSTLLAPFAGGKTKTTNASINDNGREVSASYSGVASDANDAKSLSGKRTLAGTGQINDFILDAEGRIRALNEMGRINTLAKRNDYARDLAQQNLNRFAGANYSMNAIGKKGMKILSRQELQAILAKQKLQNGGVVGIDTNLLPEGALHARLNHLQDTNPDLEDTTRKGIPVLDESGQQVAEIEHSELILRLEITKKIEELMKDGSEEAMIEAGKILVDEIIDNTQDNTGKLTDDED